MKTLLATVICWAFAAILFAKLHSGGLTPHYENLMLLVFGLVIAPLAVSSAMGRHCGGSHRSAVATDGAAATATDGVAAMAGVEMEAANNILKRIK